MRCREGRKGGGAMSQAVTATQAVAVGGEAADGRRHWWRRLVVLGLGREK